MLLLLVFAFLAGVVTVVSPCVLPVLPLILSTSSGGGRSRPVGIVLGLAAAFTAATLAVAAAAQLFALPAIWLRWFAIMALGVFGLSLLVPAFGRVTERWLSPLARRAGSGKQRGGFGGGLLLGASLGLLWAPCVGPIMASVIAATVTTGASIAAVVITLSYALGAGVPMLVIAYGTRHMAGRIRSAGKRSGVVQQAFGAVTLLACLALLFGLDARLQSLLPSGYSTVLFSFENQPSVHQEISALDNRPSPPAMSEQAVQPTTVPVTTAPTSMPLRVVPPTTAPTKAAPKLKAAPGIALDDLGPAPELTGITGWINSEPMTMSQLKGKVVIVDFWTFECYNCLNTKPYVRALYDKYHSQGLEIIGVHTPEFAVERVPENVKNAVKEQGINWPVALDPDYKTWNAYNNLYWPAFYFIDAKGHIRYTHFGEGNYDYNEKVVQQLLSDAGPTLR